MGTLNTLYLLDHDGFELAKDAKVTIAQGKKIAARLLADTGEYPDAHRAEIRRNSDNECIWDSFRR